MQKVHRSWFLLVAIFVLAPLSSALASASKPPPAAPYHVTKVFYDQQQMPRCLTFLDGNGTRVDVAVIWDQNEKYHREIFLNTRAYGLVRSGSPNHGSTFTQTSEVVQCSQSYRYQSVAFSTQKKLGLSYSNFTPFTEALQNSDIAKRLEQIELGADVYTSLSPEEFFAAHKDQPLTRAFLRKVSKDFGMGYALQVARLVVLSKPANQAFTDKVDRFLENPSESQEISKFFGHYKIIYVRGAFWEYRLTNPEQEEPLRTILKLGIPAQLMVLSSLASIEQNAASIRKQIETTLLENKDVILVGVSKGVPEIVKALDGFKNPSSGAQVRAVVNLSGTLGPSFVADWMMKFPQWQFVIKKRLEEDFNKAGYPAKNFDGLADLRPDRFNRIFKTLTLDPKIYFFNIYGLMTGDGLAEEGSIVRDELQEPMIRSHIRNFSANDGFVEIPYNELPEGFVKHSYTLLAEGSHHLLDDGVYRNLQLSDPDQLAEFSRGVVLGLIKTLVEAEGPQ